MPLRELRAVARADIWVAAAVGVVAFLLAYDRGGYELSTRASTAIVALWALLLGVGLGVWPRARVPFAARVVVWLLVAFAAWTFASIWWANSAEDAFTEFNRVTMYIAIFVLGLFAGTSASVRRWGEGLALAVAATGVVALVSRCFPSMFSLQGFPTFLPGAAQRLSFPIGYWNGLGIFVGFGYPLWLGLAVRATRWWTRILTLLPFPSFAAVIYLTSSRGGIAAACVGTVVFLAATTRRWSVIGALAAAGVGSAAALLVLLPRDELVDGPLRSHTAAIQGHEAFLLIVVISVSTGVVYAVAHRLLGRLSPSSTLGRVFLAAVVVGLAAAVVVSDPARRFEDFKELPAASDAGGIVQTHFLSGSGSGRWQFWMAAVHEWESAPVIGRGAGSYEPWWAEHASFSYFTRNAHSLYLEVLGELGVVGFLLLAAALGYGVAGATLSVRRYTGEERIVAASLLGVTAAFIVAAGFDWIWQLTAVSGVGLVCLALLLGPASARAVVRRHSARWRRFALGSAALVLACGLAGAQAIPWLTDLQIRASESAVKRNDGNSALRHGLDARKLQPWAASPYLQLALVQEQRRDLRAARKWIAEAIERNSIDWRFWLVAARIETKAGDVARARASLLRAKALNPRSPLFAEIGK